MIVISSFRLFLELYYHFTLVLTIKHIAMKKSGILLVVAAFVLATFMQMNSAKKEATTKDDTADAVKIPKKVQAVIDKSCFGCHSADSKSDKAKDKLRWDNMQEYSKEDLVSIFDEIIEVSEKQEMPPKKFLEKKPEVKPSDKEYEALIKWAEKEADKLLK